MVYLDKNRKKAKTRQILKGERREHVVNRVMDVLRDWRASPFESEGSLRAGLRSALCLEGHGWARADGEAETILRECFRSLGAVRPTWDQGQPEHADISGVCAWCKALVSPGDTGTVGRFCSEDCARSIRLCRAGEWSLRTSSIARAAALTIRRETFDKINCLQCQKLFTPHGFDSRGRKFCSTQCAGQYRRRIPERNCLQCQTSFQPQNSHQKFCCPECGHDHMRLHPKQCAHCGDVFQPDEARRKFCSVSCVNAAERPALFLRACAWCGLPFWGKHSVSRFCTVNHKSMDYHERTGRKKLKRPADSVISINADIFDRLFMDAA